MLSKFGHMNRDSHTHIHRKANKITSIFNWLYIVGLQ